MKFYPFQRVAIVADTQPHFVGKTGRIVTILTRPMLKSGRLGKPASHPYLVDIDGADDKRWYNDRELEVIP